MSGPRQLIALPLLAVDFFGAMYTPAEWSTAVNELFPQIMRIVTSEAPANSTGSQDLIYRSP